MESKEVIVLVKNNPYYENSASSNRMLSLMEGLKLLEVKLTILVLNGYLSNNEKQDLGKSGNYKGIIYYYLNDLLITNKWVNRLYSYFGREIHRFFYKRKFEEIIKDFNGILWVSNDRTCLKSVFNSKKQNTGLKIFIELSEIPDFFLSQKISAFHKRVLKSDMNYLINNLDNFTGIALMTKYLYTIYKDKEIKGLKLLHLPMTVDLNRFQKLNLLSEDFSKPYILFVGVMNDKKDGVNILIESFARITTEFPALKLYLVGPWQPDTIGHLKRIDELALNNKIKWMGEFQKDEIPSIISNAHLLVLPRPNSDQAKGGFPTKLGEYLASGVPVCATSVGEIPNYLIDNESVFFAEPGSIESFTLAMKNALADYINAKRIGLNGKAVAEIEFNKDIQSKKLYEFLKLL